MTDTATPGDRIENWDIRTLAIDPHQPQVLRSDDETRAIAIRLPSAAALHDHQVHERACLLVADGEIALSARDAGSHSRATVVCTVARREGDLLSQPPAPDRLLVALIWEAGDVTALVLSEFGLGNDSHHYLR